MRLAEKVAIVTGAGSGIGRAIAGLFAREGARVVVADRDADRAAATVAEIAFAGGQAIALTVDVTEGAAVERMAAAAAERFGRIDVLVNNAAYSEGDDILTMDEAMWDRNMDIVLKSVFLCSKAVLPRMIDQGRGAIVNISSVNGMGTFGEEAYSAAKAGVNSLSRNMATKYAHLGVRVNVVSPGTIQTPLWQPRLEQDPLLFEKLADWYPMGRVGQPEDVAGAALFLASEEAAWITGINLVVDGGLMASR